MKINKKRLLFSFLVVSILCIAAIYYCNNRIIEAAQNKTFTDVNEVPHHHVGLLLGTGKYLRNGKVNPYYDYRIDATIKLLRSGKIDYLVISGDNSRSAYNEPEMMRADLMAAGFDSTRFFLDYAGFRTFDSMIRLREIFSQDSVLVISQQFHNERALYIASREGITAFGFNAQDVPGTWGFRTQFREKLARVKVFVDFIFSTDPKFLGPKVMIP